MQRTEWGVHARWHTLYIVSFVGSLPWAAAVVAVEADGGLEGEGLGWRNLVHVEKTVRVGVGDPSCGDSNRRVGHEVA